MIDELLQKLRRALAPTPRPWQFVVVVAPDGDDVSCFLGRIVRTIDVANKDSEVVTVEGFEGIEQRIATALTTERPGVLLVMHGGHGVNEGWVAGPEWEKRIICTSQSFAQGCNAHVLSLSCQTASGLGRDLKGHDGIQYVGFYDKFCVFFDDAPEAEWPYRRPIEAFLKKVLSGSAFSEGTYVEALDEAIVESKGSAPWPTVQRWALRELRRSISDSGLPSTPNTMV